MRYLLDEFTLQNCYGHDKNVPACVTVLNRNPLFNKGVNKILKMTVMRPGPAVEIADFIQKRFPVGTLTCRNLISLVRFLAKVSVMECAQSHLACTIMKSLFAGDFFKRHLMNCTVEQVKDFLAQVQDVVMQVSEDFEEALENCTHINVPILMANKSEDDMRIELVQ